MSQLARLLLTLGVVLLAAGAFVALFGRRLGHLPGDIRIGDSVFVPLGTCILLSLVLTVIVNVVARIFWR